MIFYLRNFYKDLKRIKDLLGLHINLFTMQGRGPPTSQGSKALAYAGIKSEVVFFWAHRDSGRWTAN